jgi:FkbM family methyltransferase
MGAALPRRRGVRPGRYLAQPARLLRRLQWSLIHHGPRRDITVEAYNGRLTFDSRDRIIGKKLWVERAYEREYIEAVAALLREQELLRGGGTVVDVGANIGMICIALLRKRLFERGLAFEPAPDNVRLLRRNIADNHLDDCVTAFPYALTSMDGTLELELAAENSGDNRVRRDASPGEYDEDARATVQVQARTLDSALAAASVDAADISLIWVDIQGHDADFLIGARNVIRPRLPVVCEVWPYGILRSGTTRERYMQIVTGLFTTAWLLDEGSPRAVPAAELDAAFDTHAGSRQYREVMLLRE